MNTLANGYIDRLADSVASAYRAELETAIGSNANDVLAANSRSIANSLSGALATRLDAALRDAGTTATSATIQALASDAEIGTAWQPLSSSVTLLLLAPSHASWRVEVLAPDNSTWLPLHGATFGGSGAYTLEAHQDLTYRLRADVVGASAWVVPAREVTT